MIAFTIALMLGGALPSPAATPPVILPDGTYTYSFNQQSTVLGIATIAVVHAGSVVKIHEVTTLAGRSRGSTRNASSLWR